MRSMKSSSEIKTIIRDNYKKYWTVPAIGLFIFLCSGFIPTILVEETSKEWIESMTLNANVGYIIAMLVMSIGSGMTVFSYLQNPGASNYMHSLPVGRGKLFRTNILSGLLMIAGPLLINGLLMCAVTGSVLFIKWMVISAIGCYAIFTVTVFAATVSGNTLMHLFNAVFFNGIVTIVTLVFYALCEALLLGYAQPDGMLTFILRSNAFTAFIGEGMASPMIWMIYLLVSIVAIIAGWIFYRRRPIERTGESLVFSWTRVALYVICVFAGAVLLGLFFAEIMNGQGIVKFGVNMIIGIVIGALFVFIIGSLMIDRSAKIFTKRNLLPACLAFLLAIGTVTVFGEDVLGYNDNIPEAGDVKTVYVDTTAEIFEIRDDDDNTYTFPGEAIYYENTGLARETPSGEKVLGMTSAESIGAAIDLQKALLKQDWNHGFTQCYVGIVYELKNGKNIRRNYPVMIKDMDADVIEFADNITDAANAYCSAKEFREAYRVMNIREKYFEDGSVTVYPTGWSGEDDSFIVSGKDATALKKAIDKDFKDAKAGGYKVGIVVTGTTRAALKEDAYDDYSEVTIPVPKDGKHTNAWLKAYKDKQK